MSIFKLHLKDLHLKDVRIALYDPFTSSLKWEDNGLPLFEASEEAKNFNQIIKISPENPGHKSKRLKKIKIQMGFACNFSCNYCSQNNQRNFYSDTVKKTVEKVPLFFSKMQKWFDGGEDGLGKGVHLEFWGGETLLYWEAVKLLTIEIRKKYPNISLALFTNGSLVKKEMADFSKENKLHFIISHDGPTFNEDRGKDPFDIPSQAEGLNYLFQVLNPLGLISFNATVSFKNYSLLKIREYIANKLKVESRSVSLTYDLATPYDSEGLAFVANEDKRIELIEKIFNELVKIYPFDINIGMLNRIFSDFYESIIKSRESEFLGQKCGMDQPSSIAVDIDGNILTCQNVTAKGGHKVGHIDDFENVKLNTAYHWSKRLECVNCPVVQICKGSCMFLEGDLWRASCNQHFIWSLSYLSFMIFAETNRKLVLIEGDKIRYDGIAKISLVESL